MSEHNRCCDDRLNPPHTKLINSQQVLQLNLQNPCDRGLLTVVTLRQSLTSSTPEILLPFFKLNRRTERNGDQRQWQEER